MIEVHPNLHVGSLHDCSRFPGPIIHACKEPCHRKAVGYNGKLPTDHPSYLSLRKPGHLYLNMIDPPTPLFHLPLFLDALDFIDEHLDDASVGGSRGTTPVLVHCNQGQSRAPSIALLWLATRTEMPSASFDQAAYAYRLLDPNYDPGTGIRLFLDQHWQELTQ
jgi:protein-tyrosine phosphatase